MRGWLFVSLALLACKMDNPAFELHGGTDSTGTDEADGDGESDDDGYPDGGGTGDGGGGTGGDDGHTDATEATDDATSEPDVCDYGKTPPLRIVFDPNDPQAPSCPLSVEGFFHATEAVANGWVLTPCYSEGCSQCSPADQNVTLTMWPLAPQEVVEAGCLDVQLEAFYREENGCHYRGATIWNEGDGSGPMPVVVGAADSYGIPNAAANALGGLQFDLERLWECPCNEVEDLPECCESDPPAAYKLYAGDQYAYPGEWVPVELGPGGEGREYRFHNVQSYFPGVCGEDVITAWALMRP